MCIYIYRGNLYIYLILTRKAFTGMIISINKEKFQ